MSNLHVSVKNILEDVYTFLVKTTEKELTSSSAVNHKEKLLVRLRVFAKEFPDFQLSFDGKEEGKNQTSGYPPSSPIPYVDMNCGSIFKIPLFPVDGGKDSYDICSSKDNYDSMGSQSVTESEDFSSEEAKSLPEVAACDLYACEKSGYLDKKKRESMKGWLNPFQKRWCAIKNGVMYYYEKTSDRKQKGCIILSGYEVRALPEDSKEGKKYNNCFELVCPGRRTYQFSAPSEQDLHQWIKAIEENNLSFGKPISTESCLNSTKQETSKSNFCDMEDIYETLEDEEVEEKESLSSEGTISSAEEVGQDQIFDFNNWYVGLWDCSGADPSELSFLRGDLIHVVSKEYENFSWWIGEAQGKIGFVPKSYLMEAYEAC